MNITIISGTNRPDNKTQHVAAYLQSKMSENNDLSVQIIKPADFDLSVDGNDEENKSAEYTQIVSQTDAFIIVSPEYNHSFPGSLKSLLDKELKAYNHRAVGLVGVSSGLFGGARAVESLLPVVRELGLTVTHTALYAGRVGALFDQNGKPNEEVFEKSAKSFIDELIWVAKSLKWGRENL